MMHLLNASLGRFPTRSAAGRFCGFFDNSVRCREHIGVSIPEEQQRYVPVVYLVTPCVVMTGARIFGLIFQEAISRATDSCCLLEETRLRLREWV